MGKRSSQKKNATMLESDDSDSVSSSSTMPSDNLLESSPEEVQVVENNFLDECVDALYEKRGTTREKALESIIKAFDRKVRYEYVQKKFATILSQCLSSIKRGSAKEVSLAAHLIGLLAITTGPGDNAHEILEESIGPISEALKSRTETSKISSLLECLAIITFIGGEETEQTEKSMQLMWQVASPKLSTNVVAVKSPPAIIASAVSAWVFLLTAINASTRSPKSWQESISFFSTLLEKDDRSVRIAAGEALALVYEIGNFKKLADESRAPSETSNDKAERSGDLVHMHGLRSKVMDQVRKLSAESGGKGSAKKDLNSQRNTFKDILEFLEDGYSPETSVKIGAKSISSETWTELIQLNFIKHFLGGGFVNHMQQNECLQDFFGFTPEKSSGAHHHLSGSEKRMLKSPNSGLNKARTQTRNKERMLSQSKNTGLYSAELDA